jgi:transcription termination factor NusB
MSFTAHKFNEIVFQLLFSLDMGESEEGDLIPFLMRELSVTRKTVRDAYTRAKRIYDTRKELDEVIAAVSKGYELERIGRVERNIIRCALYELYPNNLKNREFGKAGAWSLIQQSGAEAAQIQQVGLQQVGRCRRDQNPRCPAQPKTDSSSCLGINDEPLHSREEVISEALRITRKFSTKEALRYVNALLDEAIYPNGKQPSVSSSSTETA